MTLKVTDNQYGRPS